jgi:DNA gyrase inhibitor GyrI
MRERIASIAREAGMLLRERRAYPEASEFLSILVDLQDYTPKSTVRTDRLAGKPINQPTYNASE